MFLSSPISATLFGIAALALFRPMVVRWRLRRNGAALEGGGLD